VEELAEELGDGADGADGGLPVDDYKDRFETGVFVEHRAEGAQGRAEYLQVPASPGDSASADSS